jgi:small subunit ribosomal protein S6
MYIIDPDTDLERVTKLNEAVGKLIEKEGGTIIRFDDGGKRTMAYPIKKKTEGYYMLYEIEGSGQEILELERRMRVNDMVIRYIRSASTKTAKRLKRCASSVKNARHSVPSSASQRKNRLKQHRRRRFNREIRIWLKEIQKHQQKENAK